jgi:hypothetical protein
MVLDVEFVVADVRPLLGKERQLLEFLKQLHHNNATLTNKLKAKSPFFRSVGKLNTFKKKKRTYFKAREAVKFDLFQKHQIQVKPGNIELKRRDHIRRYFASSSFGVVNSYRIGLEFELIAKPDGNDKNVIFELIKFIFSISGKVAKNESLRKLDELGDWLRHIVSSGTKGQGHSWFMLFGNNEKVSDKVKSVGIIATVEYSEGEIKSLPNDSVFIKKINSLEIHYYDFYLRSIDENVRIYFVKKCDGLDKAYLHQLKKNLFSVRSNFLCLNYAVTYMSLSTKQLDYIDTLKKGVASLINEGFNFLLSDAFIDSNQRIDTEKKIRKLETLNKVDAGLQDLVRMN